LLVDVDMKEGEPDPVETPPPKKKVWGERYMVR
jgi:hypothetical protein